MLPRLVDGLNVRGKAVLGGAWRSMQRHALILLAGCGLIGAAASPAFAQAPPRQGCVVPASERSSEIGCYLDATETLGALPAGQTYWHLYTYPSRPAAEAVNRPNGTIVEAFGKIWLYVIAEQNWRPGSGERVAVIGPLKTIEGRQYTARYMEAAFAPGMVTAVHKHSGPEAWYLVAGSQCLETPDGFRVVRPGESAVVPEGPPMILSSVGGEMRRSVVLVLHAASQPWGTLVPDWQPKGLCPK